jgi:hypothetical protein
MNRQAHCLGQTQRNVRYHGLNVPKLAPAQNRFVFDNCRTPFPPGNGVGPLTSQESRNGTVAGPFFSNDGPRATRQRSNRPAAPHESKRNCVKGIVKDAAEAAAASKPDLP